MVLPFALASMPASAADPIAESLFQEALTLMEQGKFREACPKLETSQKLEAKSGTMTVLASCNEQIGKSATAWAQYKEAAALARAQGRKEHMDKASELAAALEPKLSKLQINAQALQGGTPLTVKLDGNVVLEGVLGAAFAIDPGLHTLEATAPGKRSWSIHVEIADKPETTVIAVPALEAEKPPAPPPQAPRPVILPPVAADPHVPRWAWIAGATALASMGVSVGFLIDQRMASDALDEHCGGAARDRCTPVYDFKSDRDREKRDFGLFVGFGIGGLGLAAASLAGILTARPSGPRAPSRLAAVTPWLGHGVIGASVDLRF